MITSKLCVNENLQQKCTLALHLQIKSHPTFQARSDSPILTIKDAPEKRLVMRKVLANYYKKNISFISSEEKINPGKYYMAQADISVTT